MSDILRQAEQAAVYGVHLSRERDAFLYIRAWDRGDFETMGAILSRAEHDPELACILDDIHDCLLQEEHDQPTAQAYQRADEMVQRWLNEQGDQL